MRISDWSSDVCSSDLGWRWAPYWILAFVALWPAPGIAEGVLVLGALAAIIKLLMTRFRGGTELLSGPAWALTSALFFAYRSEEHTSELQSLMRISYAVFRLNVKTTLWPTTQIRTIPS